MRPLFLADFIGEIKGEICQGPSQVLIENVSTSLRALRDHTLYFVKGTTGQVDPINFENCNHCVIVTDRQEKCKSLGPGVAVVLVKDVEESLREFVNYYRGLFNIPVIGVTGTCGKTTTKDMIAFLLAKRFSVSGTFGCDNSLSRNLPYLLGIDDSVDVAVFEMGVAYPGNISRSCRYFKPTTGIITNIGVDHLEGCNTLENYIKAKAELLEGLSFAGTLILNHDDQNTAKIDLGPLLYANKMAGF